MLSLTHDDRFRCLLKRCLIFQVLTFITFHFLLHSDVFCTSMTFSNLKISPNAGYFQRQCWLDALERIFPEPISGQRGNVSTQTSTPRSSGDWKPAAIWCLWWPTQTGLQEIPAFMKTMTRLSLACILWADVRTRGTIYAATWNCAPSAKSTYEYQRWQWVSGSRVKWVNKSEWVTWGTGQYSWPVDPWSS